MTKDLKKPHSSRWVGGEESQRQAERQGDTVWHGDAAAAAEWAGLHSSVVDKKWEE